MVSKGFDLFKRANFIASCLVVVASRVISLAWFCTVQIDWIVFQVAAVLEILAFTLEFS